MAGPIYLDYNATTPVADEVVEAMIPALRDGWGNASSPHAYGTIARQMVDAARAQVAALLGCSPGEIVFTSGGSESNNMAIIGAAEALEDRGRHIVTSAIEHPAVDRVCRHLETRGWTVGRVEVGIDGRVDPDNLARMIRPDTTLITVMHAQNETGVIQPLQGIVERKPPGAVVHTDAAQSVGKIPVSVDDLGVDLLSIAGHKLYGPKGVGALYVRAGTPLSSFLHGAGHESGRRAGTEAVPAIVGLGTACDLARREAGERVAHLTAMRDRLADALRARIPDLVCHGENVDRLPNTLFAALPGADADRLITQVAEVALAAGSACDAGKSHASPVLAEMGVPDDLARCTLRLTVGRPTTATEIDLAAERIASCALALRGDSSRG